MLNHLRIIKQPIGVTEVVNFLWEVIYKFPKQMTHHQDTSLVLLLVPIMNS